jgi:hypothetical protein
MANDQAPISGANENERVQLDATKIAKHHRNLAGRQGTAPVLIPPE